MINEERRGAIPMRSNCHCLQFFRKQKARTNVVRAFGYSEHAAVDCQRRTISNVSVVVCVTPPPVPVIVIG
jgi:hypothetical protein